MFLSLFAYNKPVVLKFEILKQVIQNKGNVLNLKIDG